MYSRKSCTSVVKTHNRTVRMAERVRPCTRRRYTIPPRDEPVENTARNTSHRRNVNCRHTFDVQTTRWHCVPRDPIGISYRIRIRFPNPIHHTNLSLPDVEHTHNRLCDVVAQVFFFFISIPYFFFFLFFAGLCRVQRSSITAHSDRVLR